MKKTLIGILALIPFSLVLSAHQASYSLSMQARIFVSDGPRDGFRLPESRPAAVLFLEYSHDRIKEWNDLAAAMRMPPLERISEVIKELDWSFGEDIAEQSMTFILKLEKGYLRIQLRPRKIDFKENIFLFQATISEKNREDSTSPSAKNKILTEKEILFNYDKPENIGVFYKENGYLFSLKITSWAVGIGISRPPIVKR